jgi:pyridoxal/pyridoxine/pyridoxamine kinase
MEVQMAKLTVTVREIKLTETEKNTVMILSTRVNKKDNTLMVEIDQEWDGLGDLMTEQLFAEARRIGNGEHPTLRSGWSSVFFCREE